MSVREEPLEKADKPLQHIMDDWTKNHAQAYRCLVVEGPLEASEVVVRTTVPRGRIYDILDDLVNEGVVNYRESNPSVYEAENPEGVIQDRREEIENTANNLIETLGHAYELNRPTDDTDAWVLGSWAGTVRRLRELLQAAEDSIRAIDPDPRWFETKDYRVLERLIRDGGEVEVITWNARQRSIEDFDSFDIPIWTAPDIEKMYYVIDSEHIVFSFGQKESGIKFSDKTIATVFTSDFESVIENAVPNENDG